MISKADGGADWGEYRNNNGEFRQWLHCWAYVKDPTTMVIPWAPLPWVCREAPGGEFITAMYNMGLTKRWPGGWARWYPAMQGIGRPVNGERVDWISYAPPIYGMLLPKSSSAMLLAHLRKIRAQGLSNDDFMQRLRRYVLFPKEKLNAHSGSEKARRSSV